MAASSGSLVGSLVGFAGVITALFLNALWERQRKQRDRDHERGVISASLIAELELVRETMASSVNYSNTPELLRQFLSAWANHSPSMRGDTVYRKLSDKIGLLDSSTAKHVTRTYYFAGTADMLSKETQDRIKNPGDHTLTPEVMSSAAETFLKTCKKCETEATECIRLLILDRDMGSKS